MKHTPILNAMAEKLETMSTLSVEPQSVLNDILIDSLDQVSVFAATIIGCIGVSIMVYGALKSAVLFLQCSLVRRNTVSHVRLDLGKHLALGLEFLVGKDIIESIVHPTWDDLAKLAAIILLRTFVTLFLTRELREVESELDIERKEIEIAQMRSDALRS